MLYLILLSLWFHKLICLKQSPWPKTMCAEHRRKLAWANVLGKSSYTFSRTILWSTCNSCLLEYDAVSPIKNKFAPVILTFHFDLLRTFYFLKWNRFFSTLYQSSVSQVTVSTTYYHGKCLLIYKLKDLRWCNANTWFECTKVLISKACIS